MEESELLTGILRWFLSAVAFWISLGMCGCGKKPKPGKEKLLALRKIEEDSSHPSNNLPQDDGDYVNMQDGKPKGIPDSKPPEDAKEEKSKGKKASKKAADDG